MANRAWMNFGKSYENLTMPGKVNLQFTVDATQVSGISGLKSNGYVKAVYMHSTNGSPSTPNPAAGIIAIQLRDNYSSFIDLEARVQAPVTGSNIAINGTGLTVGNVYQITVLGTSTTADFQLCGLPAGLIPAVGMAFVATHTGDGAGTGSGQVKAIGVSAISSMEMMGNSQTELGPQGVSNQGGYLYIQCLAPTISTGAYIAPMIPTAPAAGSVIYMTLSFDNSSVTVDGL